MVPWLSRLQGLAAFQALFAVGPGPAPAAADASEHGGAMDTRGVHRADGTGGGAAADTHEDDEAGAMDC